MRISAKNIFNLIRQKSAARNEGFSLIELLLGVFILAVAVGSAYALMIQTAPVLARNHSTTVAAALAEAKIEELRNTAPENITAGADSGPLNSQGNQGGAYNRSWTVLADTPEEGLMTVDVTVSWSQLGSTSNFTLTGVIGE